MSQIPILTPPLSHKAPNHLAPSSLSTSQTGKAIPCPNVGVVTDHDLLVQINSDIKQLTNKVNRIEIRLESALSVLRPQLHTIRSYRPHYDMTRFEG